MPLTMNQIFCRHKELTVPLEISGRGYSEYQVVFCKKCQRPFVNQHRKADGWFYGRSWKPTAEDSHD